jgi:hypothetical protein
MGAYEDYDRRQVRAMAEARAVAYVDGWGTGWQDAKGVPPEEQLSTKRDPGHIYPFAKVYADVVAQCHAAGKDWPLVSAAWRSWWLVGEIRSADLVDILARRDDDA